MEIKLQEEIIEINKKILYLCSVLDELKFNQQKIIHRLDMSIPRDPKRKIK